MVCKSCCKEEKRKKYKRGLWSPEEDCILRNYILKYGHGYWSEVPKLAGLQRSGKSCRLRWINYLRPGLKRGAFSQQEQMIIINAHAFLGNRWSQIASMLPGRTDNEIKNFWHTHLKKQLNICGIDTDAHNTLGGCTRKETCTKMDFVSDGEINFQSTSSEFPLKLTTPFHTDCSTRQAEFWFEDVKPNPVSKCLQKDGSFLDVLFPERLHSEGSENSAINMGSDKLLMRSQSAVGSENSSCISDQSGLLTMLEEYPLPNETNHIIASAESNPGINMPTLSSDGSDSGFPCERNLPILCNDFSTTSADITSMNMSEYWHNISYNEVDLGMHQSPNLIQNCCLFDVDFG